MLSYKHARLSVHHIHLQQKPPELQSEFLPPSDHLDNPCHRSAHGAICRSGKPPSQALHSDKHPGSSAWKHRSGYASSFPQTLHLSVCLVYSKSSRRFPLYQYREGQMQLWSCTGQTILDHICLFSASVCPAEIRSTSLCAERADHSLHYEILRYGWEYLSKFDYFFLFLEFDPLQVWLGASVLRII